MHKALFAAVCGLAVLKFGSLAAAPNVVGYAVRNLHLSPQQLLSLRDFLGGFDRGVDIEADGANRFVLREAASKAYAGELSLQVGADGVLQADRVSSPARLDLQRSLRLPLHIDAKTRARIGEALAASQVLAADASSASQGATSMASLPADTVAGIEIGNGAVTGNIVESRAVFLPDGSGSVSRVHLTLGQTPAPLHIAEKYFAPIRSDGTQAWRGSVMEIDANLQMAFADFEARSCSARLCKQLKPAPAPETQHVIRWARQLIPAVPPSLLAQLAPPALPNSVSAQAAADAEPGGVSPAPAGPASDATSADSGGR